MSSTNSLSDDIFISSSFSINTPNHSPEKVNAEVPQGSILGSTLCLLYINDLPDDVIYNIAIYADDIPSTLSVIRIRIRGNS